MPEPIVRGGKILVAEDSAVQRRVLERLFRSNGFSVRSAKNGADAAAYLSDNADVRLVISDWEMPGMDGLSLCRWIRRERGGAYTFVILLTGREGRGVVVEGLEAGADEFVAKPVDPTELLLRVRTGSRLLGLQTRDAMILALAKLAESRDTDTGAHLVRTQAYCRLLATDLAAHGHPGMDAELVELIWLTSPLHDIGKVGITDQVLQKPGKLTEDEFREMQRHTAIGARAIEAAMEEAPGARFLEVARDIAMHHHERWDGRGYPLGLSGERIPIGARVMAVADVYDALRSRRVYKPPMPHAEAVDIITAGGGTQFDPTVVAAFLRQAQEFERIADRTADPMRYREAA